MIEWELKLIHNAADEQVMQCVYYDGVLWNLVKKAEQHPNSLYMAE